MLLLHTAQTGESSIQITLPETYKSFLLEFSAKPETDNAHLTCTVSTDGSSFHNSSNNYKYVINTFMLMYITWRNLF